MYYAYILTCLDVNNNPTFYTGYTSNIKRRILQHKMGRGGRFTKNKMISLVYAEKYGIKKDAMARERQIKKLSRKEKKALINNSTSKVEWSLLKNE